MVTPAVSRVEASERGLLALDDGTGRGIHDAGVDERHVVRQPRRAVRRDPPPVRGDKDLGDVGRDVARGAKPGEQCHRPGPEEVGSDGGTLGGIGVDRHP